MGYGIHGNPEYFDREEVPFPGVRFLANTPEVLKLHQKETGDWTKLSLEDKKACTQLAQVFISLIWIKIIFFRGAS